MQYFYNSSNFYNPQNGDLNKAEIITLINDQINTQLIWPKILSSYADHIIRTSHLSISTGF
jgi:hypothetical protein